MAPTRASASKGLDGAQGPRRSAAMARTWPAQQQRERSSSPSASGSRRSPGRKPQSQVPRRRAQSSSVSSTGSRGGGSASWKGGLRGGSGTGGTDVTSSLRSDRVRQRRDGTYDDTAVCAAVEALRKHVDRVGGAVDEVDDRLALAIRDLSIDIDAAGQSSHEDAEALGSQTDGRFERMDSWVNQLEHKLERCDSLVSTTQKDHGAELRELRERTGTVETELDEAKNAFEDQSRLVDRLESQGSAMEAQVHNCASESRETKKQVSKSAQDQMGATRDVARKLETMVSSLSQMERKLEQVEQDGPVALRRFSDRLQECEQVKLRMSAMEKREREQSQKMQQLETLVEKLSSQVQYGAAAAGQSSGASEGSATVQAQLVQIRGQLEPVAALTQRAEAQSSTSRRLVDQIAELEADHSDQLHQQQTEKQEIRMELESVNRTLSALSTRVSDQQSATQAFVIKEQMRARDDGVGSGEMMAVLERVACVEQVLKIGEPTSSPEAERTSAEVSMREELLNTVAELHGRIVSVESETKRSTITSQSSAAASNKKMREVQSAVAVLEAQVRDSATLVHSGLLRREAVRVFLSFYAVFLSFYAVFELKMIDLQGG